MKPIALMSFLILSFSTGISAKTSLSLNKGTVQLGGKIQLPIIIPKGGSTIVGLNVSPEFMYFITRSFALGLETKVARVSLTGANVPWNFGFSAGGAYFFDLAGAVYPYLGLQGGMDWQTKVKGMNFNVKTPVGILVALGSRVALDVGVPITFVFTDEGFSGVALPIGYLGIRAFF